MDLKHKQKISSTKIYVFYFIVKRTWKGEHSRLQQSHRAGSSLCILLNTHANLADHRVARRVSYEINAEKQENRMANLGEKDTVYTVTTTM